MTRENGQGLGEPVEPLLSPDGAKTLLVRTGRAADRGDGLDIDRQLDSIGLAAFQIHLSGKPGTLSAVIEQVTGKPPVLSPARLGDLAMSAICPEYEPNPPAAQAAA